MTPELRRIQLIHWGLVATIALAMAVGGVPGWTGVLAGGTAIGLATFLYATAFLAILKRGRARLAIGILFVKLAAFTGLGWLVFAAEGYRPDPVGFALGVTCFPLAAMWEALRARKA